MGPFVVVAKDQTFKSHRVKNRPLTSAFRWILLDSNHKTQYCKESASKEVSSEITDGAKQQVISALQLVYN